MVLALVGGRLATPCASVYYSGEPVFLEYEKVIIVWRPDAKIEHFVRGATFRGKGKDFGFLVPTPTQPTLAEASDKAFVRLQNLLPKPRGAAPSGGLGGGFGGGGVHVVKTQSVSGYDAAVLAASNSGSLVSWLAQNGYPARESLMPWAQSYLNQRFFMTAFKIARKEGNEAVNTSPVRMSFAMETPFYPYREPREPRPEGVLRSLSLFLISDRALNPHLKGSFQPYRMSNQFAAVVPESHRTELATELGLKPEDLPVPIVMSFFFDTTQIRPQGDLIFLPSDVIKSEK